MCLCVLQRFDVPHSASYYSELAVPALASTSTRSGHGSNSSGKKYDKWTLEQQQLLVQLCSCKKDLSNKQQKVKECIDRYRKICKHG